jgi:copper homeostasis protein
MIRPRGGDFYYNSDEIITMQKSIDKFKEIGANGFVFGVLNSDLQPDDKSLKMLIEHCSGLPVTFHRAFDRCRNKLSAIDILKNLGVTNVLSSGGGKNIIEGISNINKWNDYSGDAISWIGGGGVRANNIRDIMKAFKTKFYHTAAITDSSNILSEDEVKEILIAIKNV